MWQFNDGKYTNGGGDDRRRIGKCQSVTIPIEKAAECPKAPQRPDGVS